MENLLNEIWKPVKGYEEHYEVSNMGNVRSVDRYVMNGNRCCLLKGNPKKAYPNSNGYLRAMLYKNGQRKLHLVHRLVANAFIPNPNNLPCIDHINTIRDDNKVENLRWCTRKENSNNPLTIEHFTCQKTNKSVYYIDEQGKKISFKSISEAERKIGCSHSTIAKALKENKPVYGIQFYFETEKVTIS